MPDEGGRQWIVEPPERGEVNLYLAVGDGVDLTAEQQAALSELLRSLEAGDAEVVGHAGCLKVESCDQYSVCTLSCGKVGCGGLMCGLVKKAAATSSGTSWNLAGSFGLGSV